jgi:2-polyprenyl-3-methyl-5-hydroxy-6-metoxy-1,4-benzoquinol methylase
MFPIYKSRFSVFNYDEIPAGYYYQAMTSGHPIQQFWHRKKFEAVCNLIPNAAKVLDIGCGPGSFLSVLGHLKKEVVGVGIDVASRQIEFAKQRVASQFESDRITFQVLDEKIDSMAFPNHSFDYVTCIEVIEHIHPYYALKLLEEARRLLKPGGRVIVTTPNYRSLWPFIEWLLEKKSEVKYHEQHISKFTPNSLVKFLECACLEIINSKSLFLASPFLNSISAPLAEWMLNLENKLIGHLGSLQIIEATPIDVS